MSIQSQSEKYYLAEIRSILSVTANWMAIPLFLCFWIADCVVYPQWKIEFLMIRLLTIPCCLIVMRLSKKFDLYREIQILACVYAICLASGINLMIYLIGNPSTLYYAGLNLVSLGCLSFIPFTPKFYALTSVGIYGPYLIFIGLKVDATNYREVVVNIFFSISTMCMAYLVRRFHSHLRDKELGLRSKLNNEIINRDKIIESKTQEALQFKALSSHFSPQIIKSIREGKVDITTSTPYSEICSIFIDIADSTSKVVSLQPHHTQAVIGKFLNDSVRILLTYDITIDKFLGDGVLAFSNAPVKRKDYVRRAVLAATEIKSKINSDLDFYTHHWGEPLNIRVGIARGVASVGFLGDEKFFRTFTAVGPVVNLSARLCSAADKNQILIDADTATDIAYDFNVESIGSMSLKGFGSKGLEVFSVLSSSPSLSGSAPSVDSMCSCGQLKRIEVNKKGIYELICVSCIAEQDQAA